MGRNLEFDSQVLELNSRFLPKASLSFCLGYSLPKKEKKFLTTALETVDCEVITQDNKAQIIKSDGSGTSATVGSRRHRDNRRRPPRLPARSGPVDDGCGINHPARKCAVLAAFPSDRQFQVQ